jgi:hypothetical protein
VKQYLTDKLIIRTNNRVKQLQQEQNVHKQFSTYFWRNRNLERMRHGTSTILLSCGIGIGTALLLYIVCSVLLKIAFGFHTLSAFLIGIIPAIIVYIVFYFSSRFIIGACIICAKEATIQKEKQYTESLIKEINSR